MNEKHKKLDFIIIGAQKSGTTSLFRYLVEHPSVCMPTAKEAPFFYNDALYARGLNWYMREVFGGSPRDRLWGTATPHYMCYPKCVKRIAKALPETKLVAILREPISRAQSHYKMSLRRGVDVCSFDEAIWQQLQPEALRKARADPHETDSYVTWGEYGRILDKYLQHFSRDQLLVLFTEHLAQEPERVMQEIYDFLGIEAILPKNLGKRYHRGGSKRRYPSVWELGRKAPRLASLLLPFWDRIPYRIRLQVLHWYEHWGVRPDDVGPAVSSTTVSALQEHYRLDVAALRSSTCLTPPWPCLLG